MKASTQYNLVFFVGAAFGYAGMFHRTFRLPDWVEMPFVFIFAACAWIGLLLQRRAKRRGDPSFVPPTPAQSRRLTWLMLVAVLLSCATSPFLLPHTGIGLPFQQLVIIAVVTFIICATLIIVSRRRREKT